MKKQKYTLVVVDMQPKFVASQNERTIKMVQKEIKMAMDNKCPIVFLEYEEYGPTDKRLKEVIKGYKKCKFVKKRMDDGSDYVIRICNLHKYPLNNFRVCGVNTGACVKSTVSGLATLPYTHIKVPKGACNTTHENYKWKYFPTFGNVKTVAVGKAA